MAFQLSTVTTQAKFPVVAAVNGDVLTLTMKISDIDRTCHKSKGKTDESTGEYTPGKNQVATSEPINVVLIVPDAFKNHFGPDKHAAGKLNLNTNLNWSIPAITPYVPTEATKPTAVLAATE